MQSDIGDVCVRVRWNGGGNSGKVSWTLNGRAANMKNAFINAMDRLRKSTF